MLLYIIVLMHFLQVEVERLACWRDQLERASFPGSPRVPAVRKARDVSKLYVLQSCLLALSLIWIAVGTLRLRKLAETHSPLASPTLHSPAVSMDRSSRPQRPCPRQTSSAIASPATFLPPPSVRQSYQRSQTEPSIPQQGTPRPEAPLKPPLRLSTSDLPSYFAAPSRPPPSRRMCTDQANNVSWSRLEQVAY